MVRVAFIPGPARQAWLGGVSYFRNLIGALLDRENRLIEPIILTARNAADPLLAELPTVERAQLSSLTRGSARWFMRKCIQKLANADPLLEHDLIAHRIDVLSHSVHLGKRARVPVIAWIPDFQHRRLPEFFPESERRARDKHFHWLCHNAARIILSSHAAYQDLVDFHPSAVDKVRVLHFVASVPEPASLPSHQSLADKYGITEPYFLLPNQFWAHKNHLVVIEALAVLKRQAKSIVVLATGNTHDYRQPDHFPRLQARVAQLGLEREYRPLGIVTYGDLMGLMWHSIAVLNPSKFEGWSTTVEEAKSMGKAVILSDLPVHREQAPPGGSYFEPDDAETLGRLLLQHRAAREDHAHIAREQEARGRLKQRRSEFARRYEEIVLECLAERR